MKVKMIATKPVSVICHEGVEYSPDKNGEFDVDERHVDALRPHSLILISEASRAAPRSIRETLTTLTKENEKLRQKLKQAGAG